MATGKQKVHRLTGRITSQLMLEAWHAVRRNRGAAGVDKVSVEMFEQNLDANLDRRMRELKQRGTFQPLPARRVSIPKDAKGTKFRPLGIPAVRDRVAQEVLRRLLSPIFEAKFHDHSYGFRPGRSCHQAVEKVLELGEQGYRWVLDADISGFFDNLNHEALMQLVRDEIADGNILGLVERLLEDRLGLTLSPEKTVVTRFHEGFSFLGFDIKSRFVRMRAKSVENFKTKVRGLTRRSHNLDAEVIVKLNRVIRGTANYFATPWSHCGDLYRSLDRWIRSRLRCMHFKRKSKVDNRRVRLKHFRHMGLLSLSDLRAAVKQDRTVPLRAKVQGRFPRDRPVRESRTLVNMRN